MQEHAEQEEQTSTLHALCDGAGRHKVPFMLSS